MIHRFKKVPTPHALTLTRCSAVLGLALALAGCSSRPSADSGMTTPEAADVRTGALGTEPASARPSPTLAKRLTPGGLAMATLGVFHDSELDRAQALKLGALRAQLLSGQRAMGAELLALRDASSSGAADPSVLEGLGSSMTAKQHDLLDHALAGALELSATLSPAERLAFVVRAKDDALSSRRLAARLIAEGGGGRRDQVALAQDRANILEELANLVPDQDKVRTLGSAFVAAHARANSGAVVVPTQSIASP
jgi:hypothetical protein